MKTFRWDSYFSSFLFFLIVVFAPREFGEKEEIANAMMCSKSIMNFIKLLDYSLGGEQRKLVENKKSL